MKYVQAINNKQQMITNHKALFAFMMPAGISRTAVRGFCASKFLSNQRLKAMAAERANIIQPMTRANFIKILFHATKFVISYSHPILLLRFP